MGVVVEALSKSLFRVSCSIALHSAILQGLQASCLLLLNLLGTKMQAVTQAIQNGTAKPFPAPVQQCADNRLSADNTVLLLLDHQVTRAAAIVARAAQLCNLLDIWSA